MHQSQYLPDTEQYLHVQCHNVFLPYLRLGNWLQYEIEQQPKKKRQKNFYTACITTGN